MTTQVFTKNSKLFLGFTQCVVVASLFVLSGSIPTWSDTTINNGVFDGSTVGLNGSTNNGNINGNQNSLSNQNQNANQTQVYSPTQSVSTGGTSALVLPRNPLALPNANLGRSNFGLQFGLNNNPILGNLNSVNGKTDAMSWFLQGGLTIPFGKIPDIIANPRNNQLDDIRQQRMMDEREVFGSLQNQQNARANVQGKVVRLNAYNYATTASPKLEGVRDGLRQVESEKASLLNAPKVLALADAEVFSKPLGKGDKVGSTTTGEEYRYIGHTSSGWVKIIMSNGREGWVKGQFEYLKNDYTEVDVVTLGNPADGVKNAQSPIRGKLAVSSPSARKQ
jgi:hypothetical protein